MSQELIFTLQEISANNLPVTFLESEQIQSMIKKLVDNVSEQAILSIQQGTWKMDPQAQLAVRILSHFYSISHDIHDKVLLNIGFTEEQLLLLHKEWASLIDPDKQIMLSAAIKNSSLLEHEELAAHVHKTHRTVFDTPHQYNAFVQYVQESGVPSCRSEHIGKLSLYLEHQFYKDLQSDAQLQSLFENFKNNSLDKEQSVGFSKLLDAKISSYYKNQPVFYVEQLQHQPTPEKNIHFSVAYPIDEKASVYDLEPRSRFDASSVNDEHLTVLCMTSNYDFSTQHRQSAHHTLALLNHQQCVGDAFFRSFHVESVAVQPVNKRFQNEMQRLLQDNTLPVEQYMALRQSAIFHEISNIMHHDGVDVYEQIQPYIRYRLAGQTTYQAQPLAAQISALIEHVHHAVDGLHNVLTNTHSALMSNELTRMAQSIKNTLKYTSEIILSQGITDHIIPLRALDDRLQELGFDFPSLEFLNIPVVNDNVAAFSERQHKLKKRNNDVQKAISLNIERLQHIHDPLARLIGFSELSQHQYSVAHFKGKNSIVLNGSYNKNAAIWYPTQLDIPDVPIVAFNENLVLLEKAIIEEINVIVEKNPCPNTINERSPHEEMSHRIPEHDLSLFRGLYRFFDKHPYAAERLRSAVLKNGDNALQTLMSHPYCVARLNQDYSKKATEQYVVTQVKDGYAQVEFQDFLEILYQKLIDAYKQTPSQTI